MTLLLFFDHDTDASGTALSTRGSTGFHRRPTRPVAGEPGSRTQLDPPRAASRPTEGDLIAVKAFTFAEFEQSLRRRCDQSVPPDAFPAAAVQRALINSLLKGRHLEREHATPALSTAAESLSGERTTGGEALDAGPPATPLGRAGRFT